MKKTETKTFANLVMAILFIIGGIWAWVQTNKIRYINGSAVQPSMFPRIMIVGMLFFAVVLVIQSVYRLIKPKAGVEYEKAESINVFKNRSVQAAFAVIALCILYVALFNILGYVLDSMIVSIVIMIMIGKRNWLQMVLVSVLVPLGVWFIFYKVLAINIPMGPLTFLRNLVDMI